MTPFETVSLSPDTAADELEALRTLLDTESVLSEQEWTRLRGYRSRVLVDSTHVFVRTYDELASDLRRIMRLYSAAQE